MKIKRLTAGLAVAAMAATFFAAAPIVSANALGTGSPGLPATNTTAIEISGGQSSASPIDVWSALASDPTSKSSTIWDPTHHSQTVSYIAQYLVSTATTKATMPSGYGWTWTCKGQLPAPTVTRTDGTSDDNLGSAYCNAATGQVMYLPNPAMGIAGDFSVLISYNLIAVPVGNWPTSYIEIPVIQGTVLVTVTAPVVTASCSYEAKCLTGDVQAYAKKAKATSVSVELIAPNAIKASTTGFVPVNGIWGLAAINNADSNDKTLSPTTLMDAISFRIGANSSVVTFTPPAPNWSGIVTYEYELADYASGVADTNNLKIGLLTFTVHPTLPAIDDLFTDAGVAVTVPVLDQAIIGSAPFQDANCVFASGRNKTLQTGVGTIVNKGGSKNPVFTPADGFVGDVTLSCTVADKWDPISNAVKVVIHVGTPAPTAAPVAPATPACTSNCNGGTLVSTGGSLAAPMSSGLAAVVLLVAAGAGILVVRRRTSLAG